MQIIGKLVAKTLQKRCSVNSSKYPFVLQKRSHVINKTFSSEIFLKRYFLDTIRKSKK